MKTSDRADRDFVMRGFNVGVVSAACWLREAGWSIEDIAGRMPAIEKGCGNAAIREAGLNGGPRSRNLLESMQEYGRRLARAIDDYRKTEEPRA